MQLSNEQKNVIKRFYDNQVANFDLKKVNLLSDIECKYFMYKLEIELAMKDFHEDINKDEEEMFIIFLADSKVSKEKGINDDFYYSDGFVDIFKDTISAYM